MSSQVDTERTSPLFGWVACWLAAGILIAYWATRPFGCASPLERVIALLILALTAAALGLSVWALRFHRHRWYLVMPLVLVSLAGLGFAILLVDHVFFIDCAFDYGGP